MCCNDGKNELLMNKGIQCIDICGLSNYKLVGVDGSVSLAYSLVTDNIYVSQNYDGNDTGLCHVAKSGILVVLMPFYL